MYCNASAQQNAFKLSDEKLRKMDSFTTCLQQTSKP